MNNRGDVEYDTLIPWIIGIIVLILVGVLYFTFSDKGGEIFRALRNALRF